MGRRPIRRLHTMLQFGAKKTTKKSCNVCWNGIGRTSTFEVILSSLKITSNDLDTRRHIRKINPYVFITTTTVSFVIAAQPTRYNSLGTAQKLFKECRISIEF